MGSVSRLLVRSLRCTIARQPPIASTTVHSRIKMDQLRSFSRAAETEGLEESLHSEAEKKIGWALKVLAVGTFAYVGMNVFPLMGASFVKHSVQLVRSSDPFFKRSGAWRLMMIATDEERRLKIVEAGGVDALVDMLESASDDETRREAVKALAVLSSCDAALEAFNARGAHGFVNFLSTSSPDLEIQQKTSLLIERIEHWRTKRSTHSMLTL